MQDPGACLQALTERTPGKQREPRTFGSGNLRRKLIKAQPVVRWGRRSPRELREGTVPLFWELQKMGNWADLASYECSIEEWKQRKG